MQRPKLEFGDIDEWGNHPISEERSRVDCKSLGVNVTMPDQAVILLAEDREDDILLIRKAFQKAFITNPLEVVRDGEEAIAYLSGEGKYSNRSEFPLPDLMLLDLKMPRMN